MAEITEAQARRICEALDIHPDEIRFSAAELAALAGPVLDGVHSILKVSAAGERNFQHDPSKGAPAWRIVQRAAAGGDK